MRTTDFCRLALAPVLALALAGGAHAQAGFGLGGSEPIEIESDKLEVFDRDSTAIFTGNVTLIQGALLMKSVKLTVYYTQGGAGEENAPAAGAAPASTAPQGGGGLGGGTEVEFMIAEEKVYIDQGGQVVTGDRGEFAVKDGLLVVTGKEVVLTDGPNVVVGCRFTMSQANGQSQVDSCPGSTSAGRVKMLIQPGAAPAN